MSGGDDPRGHQVQTFLEWLQDNDDASEVPPGCAARQRRLG
jgi:hypothetical protein